MKRYFGLTRFSDVCIDGNVEWFLTTRDIYYFHNLRWQKWTNGIHRNIVEINNYDFSARKDEQLLSINFCYKCDENIECIRNDYLEMIGREEMEHSFHLFSMSMEGKMVEDWSCFLVKPHAAVRYFEPSEIQEELSVYGSLYFPIIVSGEIYERVKHIKVLEGKWNKLDFSSTKPAVWKMRK